VELEAGRRDDGAGDGDTREFDDGALVRMDVTSYVHQEKAAGRSLVTIVLKNTTSSTVQSVFRSREAASNRPELVLTP
jgi:hypothetical protein